ncbi:hypothetical protein Q9R46_02050 [Paenibacillus sp. RRE4]|uniref:hypothetical protein n=1 Tax=Paenibacillus sp. RRE4 TaxID=2962587 RepID=UPI002881F245|nr:hypothetical protein [Paenibacillus sp. RRE4]MDT0121412.1 hypothetical protein [Paenibacillus sp. RRE4]
MSGGRIYSLEDPEKTICPVPGLLFLLEDEKMSGHAGILCGAMDTMEKGIRGEVCIQGNESRKIEGMNVTSIQLYQA